MGVLARRSGGGEQVEAEELLCTCARKSVPAALPVLETQGGAEGRTALCAELRSLCLILEAALSQITFFLVCLMFVYFF